MRMPCQTSAHSPRYFRRSIHTDSLESYIMLIQYKNVQLHMCSEGNDGKAPPLPEGVKDQGETAVTLNRPLFYLQAQLGCKAAALPRQPSPCMGRADSLLRGVPRCLPADSSWCYSFFKTQLGIKSRRASPGGGGYTRNVTPR